jgi:hypothetical protein
MRLEIRKRIINERIGDQEWETEVINNSELEIKG